MVGVEGLQGLVVGVLLLLTAWLAPFVPKDWVLLDLLVLLDLCPGEGVVGHWVLLLLLHLHLHLLGEVVGLPL